jgi:hypothetical protein
LPRDFLCFTINCSAAIRTCFTFNSRHYRPC